MAKLVYVFATGGTIGTYRDKQGIAHVGDMTKNLVSRVKPRGIAIEAKTIMMKGSANMDPSDWIVIADEVARVIKNKKEASGIVILHGTDTMSYTAAALSFMLQKPGLPIVLTGAMISGSDPSSDAISNFKAALQCAANSNIAEVCVLLSANPSGRKKIIIRGCRSRKIHSIALNAFASINAPPIAFVNGGKITYSGKYQKRGTRRNFVLDTRIEPRVVLIKQNPALTNEILQHSLEGAMGAVIEGTGRGHVKEKLLTTISSFGKPVVISTQAIYGGESIGTYDIGKKMLKVRNLIPAGDMTSETAFVKLMWCLGHEGSVRKRFLENICDEISVRFRERSNKG
ncbi:MAG: asparaginase [Nitrososphaerota archaeon]|nr:asparaginase [Nitrososphaerota archaeon]